MIITTGTEPPTRCYHIQASLRLEGFPHNTSAQTFKAPTKLHFTETQTASVHLKRSPRHLQNALASASFTSQPIKSNLFEHTAATADQFSSNWCINQPFADEWLP